MFGILVTSLLCFLLNTCSSLNEELLLVTIATEENDGFRQFKRSAKLYDLDVQVFGLGETWDGGDVANTVGGGQKINLLKEGLKDYKDRDDLIIMFTDSYDVVLTAGVTDILEKFRKLNARVVFSAEGFCWPDKTLADKYPEVKVNEKRFLCSGGFIGYAKDIYEIVIHKKIENRGDDQLYYTQIFLDTELREKWNIKLDKKSEIFMNLHGALGEIMLKYKGDHSYLYNVKTGTVPVVVHGNGPIKPEFNRLANYLADGWTQSSGCLSCSEDLVSLKGLQEEDFPTVLMGLFIQQPTPFLKSFFEKVVELDYPKQKIDLLIHNSADYHMSEVSTFVSTHGEKYKSVTVIKADDKVRESDARNWALEECVKRDCHYYFNIDGDAHLDNPDTLQLLIQQNRSVIAPLIGRPGKMWSNFWGALSQTGFYARSEDYMDIVEGNKIGLWNAPYITGSYLVQRHIVKAIKDAYTASDLDPDMAFCRLLREKNHFMYVNNQHHFGHLIDSENFETNHLHNELYEIFNNPQDWEKKYLHPNYSRSLQDDAVVETPCPDVYWFPMVTETFCDHLVEEMEHYGQWSGGKAEDKRLPGGYENVPTDDIHLNQVGLDKMWLHILDKYIMPLTTKVFWGYYSNPPRSLLNFVVKYHPDRQRLLRPHHDSSTFTTNIALNHPTEFEGGGCRFLRYNCSVLATRKGWMLMHPGRLTHYHEGLPVTKGTRYILVSFNDP